MEMGKKRKGEKGREEEEEERTVRKGFLGARWSRRRRRLRLRARSLLENRTEGVEISSSAFLCRTARG